VVALNVYAAWVGMLLGCVAGAVGGLFFHREDWLNGYGSWRRRMWRLGHISFFGIAFMNIAFVFSAGALGIERGLAFPSRALIAGAITMPLICYLSAIRPGFRHFFFIPVLSVLAGIGGFLWAMVGR